MQPSLVVTAAGSILVGLVAVQLALVILTSLRDVAWQRQRHQRSLDLLGERIKAAKALQVVNQRVKYSWNGYRKFVIDRKVVEADGVCSFYLTPHDHKPLPNFKPGQFLTFQLHIDNHNKPVIRCYSLSDAPHRDYYRVTIKRVPPPRDEPDAPAGLVSNYFHDDLEPGHLLDVKAPGGNFVLDPHGRKPAVLIGGGVGITPMLSMVNTIVATDAHREVWLFYGVRHSGEHALKDSLSQLNKKQGNLCVVICYSDPRAQDEEGRDYDHAERVSVDLMKRYLDSSNYEFYICGPPPMMSALTKQLKDWGVPKSDIRTEAFGAASVKANKSVAEKPPPTDTVPITVKFSRCGKELKWDGSADNLLEFGEANGVDLEGGCRAGNCGTCEIAVLSGDFDYNQDPEYPDLKDGCCLTCVGVPKADIVLDA